MRGTISWKDSWEYRPCHCHCSTSTGQLPLVVAWFLMPYSFNPLFVSAGGPTYCMTTFARTFHSSVFGFAHTCLPLVLLSNLSCSGRVFYRTHPTARPGSRCGAPKVARQSLGDGSYELDLLACRQCIEFCLGAIGVSCLVRQSGISRLDGTLDPPGT